MEKEFRINSSLAAFETLSSRLYSNPVLAIIRELSTNANDAHLEAHVDRPFRLHIPTLDETYFDIRDYGKGIPEEFVYNIYTTFFMSTKTDDDSQTGYFGLGSKTPFSLVDSYKVISYNGGMKKTYEMAKESTGPVVRKISEEPCGSETGLEVYFDVYDSDLCYDFKKEAVEFFKGTTFMPDWNLDGIDLANYAKEKQFYTRESAELGSSYNRSISVNVAGVRFNVDYDHLELFESLLNQMDVKRVNILAKKNDVTITPSREELHYDQKTKDFIKSETIKTIENFYRKAKQTINDVPFATLISYIIDQDCDQTLTDMAKQRLSKYFMPRCYANCESRYSSRVVTSAVEVYGISSYMLNSCKHILLDFSRVKDTVKQKVVMSVLDGTSLDGNKIRSEAFRKVLKTIADREGGSIVAYVPRPGMLAEAAKWTGFKIVDWNDVVPDKKAVKKLGFITQSTLCARNGQYFHDYDKRDLEGNDIGLVALCDPSRLEFSDYRQKLQMISKIVEDTNIYLRPCTENNIEQFKNKGFKEIDDYISWLKSSSQYSAKIKDLVEKKVDNLIFDSFFRTFSESDQSIIMSHRYDPLEVYGFFREIRAHYHPQVYVDSDIKMLLSQEERERIGALSKQMGADFPMLDSQRCLEAVGLKNSLEYMLAWHTFITAQDPVKATA